MSAVPSAMTLEYMRFMLEYHDSGDGALVWRHGRLRGELAGTPMGSTLERRVRINGDAYSAAKIVWFLETGEWPKHRLRNINRNRDDIRFCNLEETYRVEGPGR